jgi:hypothetical protein
MKLNDIIVKRDALRDKVTVAQANLDTVKQELADFEAKISGAEISFNGVEPETETPKPKKGRGKVKATAQVTKPKAEAKKAEKAGTKKATKTVTAQSRKNASDGRDAVARGDRPPLKKAMVAVMGTKIMNASDILAALEAKGWAPASNDPHQYVSFMLSSNTPEVFERTEKRGHYRVRSGYLAAQESDKKGNGTKGKKKTSSPDIDQKLQSDWGDSAKPGNVAADPYGS